MMNLNNGLGKVMFCKKGHFSLVTNKDKFCSVCGNKLITGKEYADICEKGDISDN